MSSAVKYDPDLLVLTRTRGEDTTAVSVAQFTWTAGYSEDDLGTLVLESETASATISYWDDLPDPLLLDVDDELSAAYDGHVLFHGYCDSLVHDYTTTEDALPRGRSRRIDTTASFVGDYASTIERVVIGSAVSQGAYQRARQYAAVDNVELGEAALLQHWRQPIPGNSNFSTSVLDQLRATAQIMLTPFRFIGGEDGGQRRVSIVDVSSEPDVPGDIEASEGLALYSQVTWETIRPPRFIKLSGPGPDAPI